MSAQCPRPAASPVLSPVRALSCTGPAPLRFDRARSVRLKSHSVHSLVSYRSASAMALVSPAVAVRNRAWNGPIPRLPGAGPERREASPAHLLPSCLRPSIHEVQSERPRGRQKPYTCIREPSMGTASTHQSLAELPLRKLTPLTSFFRRNATFISPIKETWKRSRDPICDTLTT